MLVQGVEGDEGGLGYFGFSYYEQNQDKLNLVGVDGGDGCVTPSSETIQDGNYKPLSRPLFMYPSEKALEAARGQGVHGLRAREPARRSPRRPDRADERRRRPTRPRQALESRRRQQPAAWKPEAAAARAPIPPWGGASPLGRGRHQGAADPGGADLGAHDHRDRALAAAARRSTSSATSASGSSSPAREWSPLFEPASFGVLPLVTGHVPDHRHRACWWPFRSGSARRSTSASTPARACARRSSRSSSCSPACRRSCSATSR